MKSKRITTLIITAALAAASMAGCSGQSRETADPAKTTQANQSEDAKANGSADDTEQAADGTEQAESRTVIVGTAGTGSSYNDSAAFSLFRAIGSLLRVIGGTVCLSIFGLVCLCGFGRVGSLPALP